MPLVFSLLFFQRDDTSPPGQVMPDLGGGGLSVSFIHSKTFFTIDVAPCTQYSATTQIIISTVSFRRIASEPGTYIVHTCEYSQNRGPNILPSSCYYCNRPVLFSELFLILRFRNPQYCGPGFFSGFSISAQRYQRLEVSLSWEFPRYQRLSLYFTGV